MELNYENKELCKKCGGICCKKCGCDYYVEDFTSFEINYLQKLILENNISIVSTADFHKLPNGRLTLIPILYLRARNVDRGPVDLLSLKKQCSLLTDNGCSYTKEQRPSGGLNLIPKESGCENLRDQMELIKEWSKYQKVLQRLVKRITGKNVDEVLREDAENLFFDCISQNFDGVSKLELAEMVNFIPLLFQVYPEEYQNALNRFKKESGSILKKTKSN